MNGTTALKQAKNYVDKTLQGMGTLKGQKGDPGKDGITPHIDPTTKHWFIDSTDTGIAAEGKDGAKGLQGIPGDTPYIGENGNWWYGNTDSGIPIPSIEDLLKYVDKGNGIQDTPIGHILSYMGIVAPKHYLICDGTEYQIADYPYLAQHFIDNFGSANYFGGDGETTFAVPDLRGEFLRGTGTAIRNTGSGSNVGYHQDATEIPRIIVRNGIIVTYPINGENTNESKSDSYLTNSSVWGLNNTVNSNNYTIGGVSHYTTRPTNTSVLYCIKYEPTYYIDFNNGDAGDDSGSSIPVDTPLTEEEIAEIVDYILAPLDATESEVETI